MLLAAVGWGLALGPSIGWTLADDSEQEPTAQAVAPAPELDPPSVAPASTDSAEISVADAPKATLGDDPAPIVEASTADGPQASAPAVLGPVEIRPSPQTIDEAIEDEDPALTAIRERIAAQEFDESIIWLTQQVDLIERVSHRYDPELIEPLTLLGDAFVGKGENAAALDHYQRATHLSRVNYGLNSAIQVPIVYREANVFKAMQNFEEANDREEYAYHVLSRAHGSYDAEMLPGVYHLADWYAQTNNLFSARTMFEHALNILTATGQADSEIAIPAYRGIATSYRLERFPPYYVSGNSDSAAMRSQFEPEYADTVSINNFPAGEHALQRIIAIYRGNPEQYSLHIQIEAILDLADWYLLWEKYTRAHPLYAHAYTMINEIEGVDAAAVFAAPKLLHFPAPQTPKMPPPHLRGEAQKGIVEVTFSVSQNGHVRELSTVISEPEGMMDFRVRKSLRQSRYRPPIIEGIPSAHAEHRYQYNFTYFPKIAEEATGDAK